MLRGKVKLKILPHLNMSLRIGDIYKVRAILFVRMLTLNLQRLSKSIPTKEVCPPVITVASLVTSDPSVHSSRLTRRRFRGSYQQKLHQALYLRWYIGLHGISGDNSGLFRLTQKCKPRTNTPRHYKKKPQKPDSNHAYEGLLSLMQSILRRMDSMNNTRNPPPQVKKV